MKTQKKPVIPLGFKVGDTIRRRHGREWWRVVEIDGTSVDVEHQSGNEETWGVHWLRRQIAKGELRVVAS